MIPTYLKNIILRTIIASSILVNYTSTENEVNIFLCFLGYLSGSLITIGGLTIIARSQAGENNPRQRNVTPKDPVDKYMMAIHISTIIENEIHATEPAYQRAYATAYKRPHKKMSSINDNRLLICIALNTKQKLSTPKNRWLTSLYNPIDLPNATVANIYQKHLGRLRTIHTIVTEYAHSMLHDEPQKTTIQDSARIVPANVKTATSKALDPAPTLPDYHWLNTLTFW